MKIQVLEGIEHIRLRPGMYVGSVKDASHLLREVIDNAIDECLNGYANKIDVTQGDDYFVVSDNGRGLPTYVDEKYGIVACRLLFEKIFSGGKFESDQNYFLSSGLHGVGLTVLNALSKRLEVLTKISDGRFLSLTYEKGTLINESTVEYDSEFSTIIKSYPDDEIFESVKTSVSTTNLKLLSEILPVQVTLNGQQLSPFSTEDLKDDWGELVTKITKLTILVDRNGKLTKIDNITPDHIRSASLILRSWFAWGKEFDMKEDGSVNLVPTPSGVHVNLFRYSFGNALVKKTGLNKSDVRYGLRHFTLALVKDPQFTSQTKEKLGGIKNLNIDSIERRLTEILEEIYEEDIWDLIKNRVESYKEQIGKLSENKIVERLIVRGSDPKSRGLGIGIYDASTTKRSEAELFIVEGQSAGSNLLQRRDRRTQAVLPLRGKPLNVTKTDSIVRIINNREMKALVNAIGVGITPNVNLEDARYGKIIIVSDADPDGRNINALVLGALAFMVPEIFDAGLVYYIEPPLFKQDKKFIWRKEDLNPNKPFTRFKGLGEMNPDELYEVALNPKTRRLVQVTLDNRDEVLKILKLSSAKKLIMRKKGIIK